MRSLKRIEEAFVEEKDYDCPIGTVALLSIAMRSSE